ncbi:hypothetical protein VMCG_04471 [Cytospora schulzeri]|uniref:Uncharacterized protein n=1 Tax=Cytospora schulzeri TaxID=448051 RepID=A0A423WSW4_9PEZI|nr:hypothetical protein VMCG_04471 [Valsa malicola]
MLVEVDKRGAMKAWTSTYSDDSTKQSDVEIVRRFLGNTDLYNFINTAISAGNFS